jgi:uncharacterized protein (DUF4415 family)
MSWIDVTEFGVSGWTPQSDAGTRSRWYCEELERGQVLFFPQPPFAFAAGDREFLVGLPPTTLRLHKNISYRPQEDILRGFSSDGKGTQQRMHQVLRGYSERVTDFVRRFLSPYKEKLMLDFASFRPQEEAGRDLPLHKRNDLLHVDAFPSRPTRGGRILRVFTNIHPSKERVWLTAERFPELAQRYARDAGLPGIGHESKRGLLSRLLYLAGLKAAGRSAYDSFMLRFHDYLKENAQFQRSASKVRLAFPPLATWMVFTDGVPHAALSGQFALEQTFIVPPEALVAPEHSPIRVLEKLCGRALAS